MKFLINSACIWALSCAVCFDESFDVSLVPKSFCAMIFARYGSATAGVGDVACTVAPPPLDDEPFPSGPDHPLPELSTVDDDPPPPPDEVDDETNAGWLAVEWVFGGVVSATNAGAESWVIAGVGRSFTP